MERCHGSSVPILVREGYEYGPDGIKIKETRIYADPLPALGFMLQNKMVSAKDLGLA